MPAFATIAAPAEQKRRESRASIGWVFVVAAYRPLLCSIEQRGGVGEDGHKRDAGCQAEGCTAGGKDESVHRLYPFSGLHFGLVNPEPTGLYAEGHNALCASDLPSRRTHREVGRA